MALNMVADHPFLGVGANNFVLALPDYAGGDFSAAWLAVVHNRYLVVWSESGTGALLAFLLFVAIAIRQGWRARRLEDPVLAAIGLAFGAALAGHAVHMNFEIFTGGTAVTILWLAAGLLASPVLTSPAAGSRKGLVGPRQTVARGDLHSPVASGRRPATRFDTRRSDHPRSGKRYPRTRAR
jgi:O-antigen ligase